jgi:hypothetical protein
VEIERDGMRTEEQAAGGDAAEGLLAKLGDRFMDRAEELLGDEIDERLARIPKHVNEAGVDPFGFDPRTARYVLASMAFLYRYYFRVQTSGIETVPRGRALFIANHSGQIPLDGAMLGTSLMLDAEPPRFARSMVERWSAELPFVSVLFPAPRSGHRHPRERASPPRERGGHRRVPRGLARASRRPSISATQLVDFGLGFMRLAPRDQDAHRAGRDRRRRGAVPLARERAPRSRSSSACRPSPSSRRPSWA